MWLLHLALAQAGCTPTSIGQLATQAPPSVLVLGERRGIAQDVRRATKLAKKLSKRGPVTVALQAVPVELQEALDAHAAGRLTDEQLLAKIDLPTHWGFDVGAYDKLLLSGATLGFDLVAVGVPPEPAAEGVVVPLPPAYMHVLGDTMGEHPVPVEMEGRFSALVAHTDHRVAARAIEAWDGQGYLLIVADRLHVEGAKGISWQASLLTEYPASSVLLDASDTPCYSGDLVL